ncbi:MAG: ribosome biogenesis GTPase Der [Candidatus Omnitrophica bacterium]|nr:ribosome biogenesis GTPase Der [Candidatus Omnitrophota bacterium]
MSSPASAHGPVLAIVGRPNVGKSTLFNRLVGHRQAVVAPARGTTRDRIYGRVEWRGGWLTLIDAGGMEFDVRDVLGDAVQRQLGRALEDADGVLFVCDAQQGLVPADQMILERLRRIGKPIVLVVNKADHHLGVPPEFFSLGLDDPLAVSALHGRGTGDLLDRLVAGVPGRAGGSGAAETISVGVAIIGRQNVGKSSLLNALLRDERVIVSDAPGTTRDAVDTALMVRDVPLTLIDTAGLRHRRKVRDPVDLFAMSRSLEAIDRCDVALMVLDATQGVTRDDQRILTQVCRKGRGLILVLNKWDLVTRGKSGQALTEAVQRAVAFAAFAPVVAVSAKTGFQVSRAVTLVLEVARRMQQGLSDAECLALMQEAWRRQPPPRWRGRAIRLLGAQWRPGRPPALELTVAPAGRMPAPYQNYLRKMVHASPKLVGVPVRFIVNGPDTPRSLARGARGRRRAGAP